MKKLLFTLTVLIGCISFAQENYKIIIDGKATEIELDKNYSIQIADKTHNIKVVSKDTLFYKDDKINFKYYKDYKISTSTLEEGIKQLMLMTAEGSGVIIQICNNMNPELLNEIMLNEVTKESIGYGYKMKRNDYERTLPSKQKIKINKAILTYKDEVNIYEVASIGGKDQGVLIMTMKMDNEKESNGQKLIDLTWNTLMIKE